MGREEGFSDKYMVGMLIKNIKQLMNKKRLNGRFPTIYFTIC